jgi:hypothetical protein
LGHKKPPIRSVEVAAAETIFMNGLVELEDVTGLGIKVGATSMAATGKLIGVAAGYKPVTAANEFVPIILAHQQIFEIQFGTITTELLTTVAIQQAVFDGNMYGFAAGNTAATGLNISNMEADASTEAAPLGTAGTTIFQVHEYPKREDNELGDNVKLHVTIVEREILLPFGSVSGTTVP